MALISEGNGHFGSSQQEGGSTQGQPVLLMAPCQMHNWPLPQSCIKDSHLETAGNIPNLYSQSLQVSIWKIPGKPRLGFPYITRIRDQVKFSEVPIHAKGSPSWNDHTCH